MIIKNPFAKWDISITKKQSKVKRVTPKQPLSEVTDRNYSKIFVIGFNKTGTSTMAALLKTFGFELGNQRVAETFAEEWIEQGRTDRIIRYCETADAFQDVPFSFPDLYKVLYKRYPDAKFILTVRDDSDQWVDSLMNYHSKIYAKDSKAGLTAQDLSDTPHVYMGWSLDVRRWIYDYPKISITDREAYKKVYTKHNQDARSFFSDKQNQFLEMNVSQSDDFNRLCSFLNIETVLNGFPWANKTSDA